MRNQVELVTHPLVCTEDGRGIRVLREDEVALVMDEHAGRVTVVTDAGEVLHRPGPLAAFERSPWKRLTDDACGHPLHGVQVTGGYVFPGDWKVATKREMKRGRASAPTREGRVRVGRRMVEPRRLHRIEGHLGRDRWRVYLRDPDEVFAVRGEGGRAIMALLALTSLAEEAFELAALFDVTVVVLGGTPQWVATEFFADALRPRLGPGPEVLIVALVDFDPGGWGLVDTMVEQLQRYAIAATDVRHLVRPARFTAEELEWVLRPLPAPNEQSRSRVLNWVKRSGGVNGKPYGIHADHFRGLERLRQAFHEETGL